MKEHPYFGRNGNNILSNCIITISQAILGGCVNVQTVHGFFEVDIPIGTNDGDTKKLAN